MKKQHNSIGRHAAVVLPLVVALVFASCDNPVNPPSGMKDVPAVEKGKASVSFTVSDASGRTVLPDLSELNGVELYYTLTGKRGETVEQLAGFSESGTTLSLEPGEWIFTLKPLREGFGAVNINFTYPYSGISSVKTGGDITEETITLDSGNSTWSYLAADMPAGDYFATFSFYYGEQLAAVVSETIQVRGGFTSKETISLSGISFKPELFTKPAGDTLAEKLQWIADNAANDTNYLVEVTTNEEITPQTLEYSDKTGISITLTGSGEEQTISLSENGRMFTVQSGVTLSLENNITLAGRVDNTNSLVGVGSGGTLVLNDGAKISGNTTLYGDGGGVNVSGTFMMSGGTISGNTSSNGGGGVYVFQNSVFSKTSGVIYGNEINAPLANNTMASRGHAVYWDTVLLFRDSTLGVSDSISTADTSVGWERVVPEAALLTNGWNSGNIEEGGEEWFTFTASAANQYIHIHVKFGTLSPLYVQVYNSALQPVGSGFYVGDNGTYMKFDSSVGQMYYIRVWPYSDYSGDYEIMVNESSSPMLPETEVPLLVDGWNSGNIEEGGEEWFTFTASAANQYIHVKFGTLSVLYVQVYDNARQSVGDSLLLHNRRTYKSLSGLSVGQTYYIRVLPYNGNYSGDYEIMASESPMPLGTEAKELASGWNSGNIEVDEEAEWFTFTANAANQHIHVKFGTLTDLNVEVYDSTWQSVEITSGITTHKYLSGLSASQSYYIRVWLDYSTDNGDYEIAVSESPMAPGTERADLTSGWNSSNIERYGEEWFTFTASAANQYVHFKSGTLTDLNVEVYDSASQSVGSSSLLNTLVIPRLCRGDYRSLTVKGI